MMASTSWRLKASLNRSTTARVSSDVMEEDVTRAKVLQRISRQEEAASTLSPLGRTMHYRRATLVTLFGLLVSLHPRVALAQVDQQPQATFKSSVDLVSVTAVVRDKKGRVVRTLTPNDIVVTDAGKPRTHRRHAGGRSGAGKRRAARRWQRQHAPRHRDRVVAADLRNDSVQSAPRQRSGGAHEFRHAASDAARVHAGVRSDSLRIGRGRSVRIDVDLRRDCGNGGCGGQSHAESARRGGHHRRSGQRQLVFA